MVCITVHVYSHFVSISPQNRGKSVSLFDDWFDGLATSRFNCNGE